LVTKRPEVRAAIMNHLTASAPHFWGSMLNMTPASTPAIPAKAHPMNIQIAKSLFFQNNPAFCQLIWK